MIPAKKTILVVDDDEAVLKSVGQFLSLKGYNVDTAANGKEAIERSYNRYFNLAVLDIKLPDMDGTELLTKMQETEPRMIKVMLTGYAGLRNAIESLNKGADYYLVKPIEPEELLRIIERKLKEQEEELKMDQKKIIKYMESREKELEEKDRKP